LIVDDEIDVREFAKNFFKKRAANSGDRIPGTRTELIRIKR